MLLVTFTVVGPGRVASALAERAHSRRGKHMIQRRRPPRLFVLVCLALLVLFAIYFLSSYAAKLRTEGAPEVSATPNAADD